MEQLSVDGRVDMNSTRPVSVGEEFAVVRPSETIQGIVFL